MSFAKGYYSIIQYCPDPSRLEAVNIGVALFSPELRYLHAKFGRRRTRISQLFGKQDWEFVKLQQSAIEARLTRDKEAFQTIEEFEGYVSRRANALIMTTPRPMKVANPHQELDNLLRRLVGSKGEAAQRAARISKELEEVLRSQGVSSSLRRNVTVHPPALPKAFRAPLAYQNGRLNLIEPIQFEGQTPAAVFNRASILAVEGELLEEYKDPQYGDLALVVVAKFAPNQEQERASAATIFRKHEIPMYTFGTLEPLIEDIRRHAH